MNECKHGNRVDNCGNCELAGKTKARHEEKQAYKEKILNLIAEEILICHKENTPTSRLTSLAMKLKKI